MPRDVTLPCAPPSRRAALQVIVAAFPAALPGAAAAALSSAAIDDEADRALAALNSASDNARALSERARAVLVFARIAGGGLVGQEGDGVMRIAGASAAYYRIIGAPPAAAGGQPFSLAFFFVTPAALTHLTRKGVWRIGSGASMSVADAGRILDTTTLTEDVYAVPFGQRGMMAGLGLEGSRIFRIHPSRDLS